MKFTLSWLKEHLDTDAGASEIAARLTAIGLEVESVTDPGAGLTDLIVGEVVACEKHPNADKLRLCSVSDGANTLQIVCGAPNARAGIKVVLARPGTVIPASGEALKLGTIRGVESRGMMCSARELLLGEDHDGIIELKPGSRAGEPVVAALVEAGLLANDPLFDVSITPNRGDAASVFGIARDLAASGLGALKTEKVTPVQGKFPSPKKITLDFAPENKNACPIFAGRLIRGVKNGPAPKWVQDRLKSVGMKSISALVDATNLISQDRGRPLHVFDADKLSGNLHARMASDHEQVFALDDKTYVLDKDTIVIADDSYARGIAGIMGGMDTGSFEDTKNVFIESAYFDPARIARAGRKQGIISDARYRFERGVDPQFVLPGLELCTRLILEWCGGEASDVVIAGELPPPHKPILFDAATVEKLGGITVPREKIISILEELGFVVEDHAPGEQSLHVTPPSWRHDVDGPADLVEEVVRIHGLTDVPSMPLPRTDGVAAPVLSRAQRRTRTARRALAVRGFNECVSFSFIARDQAALFGGGDEARQLSNPIASDLDALRPSVLPSLLAAASRNAARGFSNLQLFEIGAAFDSGMPEAQKTVAAAIRTGHPERHWQKGGEDTGLFAVKADLLAALEAITGAPMSAPITQGAPGWYHPGRSGTIAMGPPASSSEAVGQRRIIAQFGELHPRVLAALDLKVPAAGFEIFLDAIPDAKSKGKAKPLFQPSPFQAIERDFAFVVDAKVAAGEIVKAVKLADRNLIEQVTVFDVYESKGVPEGQKSIAVAVRIQPKDATLTDAEIEALAQKIVSGALKLGASLRS
ncbi:MAG TPA: phenylalanine--tRNA ligase subunit beta [Rhizomicrobium sp.]|jgi:phenylalanyl-tRNA synthetase beta chain|nr:phenylalanine--tRNA ligase subunit beta [Rhizomicrobium sp.]